MTTWDLETDTEQEPAPKKDKEDNALPADRHSLNTQLQLSLRSVQSTALNPAIAVPAPGKLAFYVKSSLVLVDSGTEDWGIIEDTLDDILWQPGKGEVVGTWSRTRYDNLIHLSLCTSINALQDRAIQTFAHYAEERTMKKTGVTATRAPRKSKKPEDAGPTKAARISRAANTTTEEELSPSPSLSIDEELKFNALRAKLRRAK